MFSAKAKFDRGNKRAAAVLVVIVLLGVLAVVPRVARADAGPHGSCMGLEASNISPAGSSDEFPGGMPELIASVRDAFPGVPFGFVIRSVAQVHAGSHEACE